MAKFICKVANLSMCFSLQHTPVLALGCLNLWKAGKLCIWWPEDLVQLAIESTWCHSFAGFPSTRSRWKTGNNLPWDAHNSPTQISNVDTNKLMSKCEIEGKINLRLSCSCWLPLPKNSFLFVLVWIHSQMTSADFKPNPYCGHDFWSLLDKQLQFKDCRHQPWLPFQS